MLWTENHWAIDVRGIKTATAFVLKDAEDRELDTHALRFDDNRNGRGSLFRILFFNLFNLFTDDLA